MSADLRPPTRDRNSVDLDPRQSRLLVAVTFHGRPGTANAVRSALTTSWMQQVREQASAIKVKVPPGTRLWARIDYRLYSHIKNQPEWDLDNLTKAFFDALADAGFFGPPTPGRPHKGDERVDFLQLRKRTVETLDEAGARIELYAVTEP